MSNTSLGTSVKLVAPKKHNKCFQLYAAVQGVFLGYVAHCFCSKHSNSVQDVWTPTPGFAVMRFGGVQRHILHRRHAVTSQLKFWI